MTAWSIRTAPRKDQHWSSCHWPPVDVEHPLTGPLPLQTRATFTKFMQSMLQKSGKIRSLVRELKDKYANCDSTTESLALYILSCIPCIFPHPWLSSLYIPKDTKIEDIKEFFQIEVMTSSPSPNFFSNRRYCFLRPISHNIFYLKKKVTSEAFLL